MTARLRSAYAIAGVLLIHGMSSAQNWHSIGPPASPWSMCVGPNTVLLGTQQAGILRSTDAGVSWKSVQGPIVVPEVNTPNNSVTCMDRDPFNLNVVYAGFGPDESTPGNGFFKSTDDGATWQAKNSGLPRWSPVTALSASPFHRDELYISVLSYGNAGIYRSTDGGDSWTLFCPVNGAFVSSLVFDGSDSTIHYAVEISGIIHIWKNGVDSVVASSRALNTGARVTVLLNPKSEALFYVYDANMFRCALDGNWVSLFDSIYSGGVKVGQITSAAIDQTTGTVFVCADCGVFRTTDDGVHWTLVSPYGGMTARVTPNSLFLEGFGGFFASGDEGNSWWRLADGPNISRVYDMSLVTSPGGDVLYAVAGDPSLLYKSTNDGSSWTQLSVPLPTVVKANPLNPNTVFAARGNTFTTPAGLYRSRDGGITWKQVLPDSTVAAAAIEISQRDTNRVLIAVPGGVMESTNSGDSWRLLSGMSGSNAYFETNLVKVSDTHPSLIVTGDIINYLPGTGIYVSADSGKTWTQRAKDNIISIAITPGNDSIMYYGSLSTVYRSTDQGLHWNPGGFPSVSTDGYVNDIQIAPDDPAFICATMRGMGARAGGLMVSTNAGSTWSALVFPGVFDSSRTKLFIERRGDKYRIHVGTLSYGWYVGEIPRPLSSIGAENHLPSSTVLFQNFPNPFNPTTIIRYALSKRSVVSLSVFNTLGQNVITLVDEAQEAGNHEARFSGEGLASGVYFYRLQAGDFIQTKKLILLH